MKRGFLLMNTGAPDAPTEAALQTYLQDFLEDPAITDVPKLLRAPLVHWIVLPQQLEEMVAAYAAIWTDDGCPMIRSCTRLAQQLEEKLGTPVALGMAHGNPSYKTALAGLLDAGVDDIGLLWMFPQYDLSHHECVKSVKKELKHLKSKAILRVAPPFYDAPSFIAALAGMLQDTEDYIVFNYHGLSEHALKKADPMEGGHCLEAPTCCNDPSLAHDTCYRFQCLSTSRSIAGAANIPDDRYITSFQTRHKHGKWLKPHTGEMLQELPKKGIKRVTVISPAFLCDGLETLEEIEQRSKYLFQEAGGESFRMIPCLNDSPAGLNCLHTQMTNADQWPTVT